jgi:glycerate kinase
VTVVVVAPAPFKGALSAAAAARAIGAGLRLSGGVETRLTPVADGGEGTLDALVAAARGRRRALTVPDPLGRPVEAGIGQLPGGVAVVELAQASGYERLRPEERDPEATTTLGTGELIRAALDLGARRVIVGLGGSATTDGGLGLARALGVRALDAQGRELEGRGADLARVARIDLSGRDPRIEGATLEVACDVDTPFHGPRGAARVFGPQKGASPEAVERLDAGLATLADAVRRATGIDLQALPGSGAAGGAAGGLAALLGARLTPGAPLVLEAVGLAERLQGADLCVTGEGRLDETSAAGKAPVAVAAACVRAGVPCVALCGELGIGPRAVRDLGFAAAFAVGRGVRSLADALAATEADRAAAAAAVGGLWARAVSGGRAAPGGRGTDGADG